MELTPGDREAIAADTATIVGDLLQQPDAFAGGNWSRLEGLVGAERVAVGVRGVLVLR